MIELEKAISALEAIAAMERQPGEELGNSIIMQVRTHDLAAMRQALSDVKSAFVDVTAHLAGAASAYRDYGARHRSLGRAHIDPFFKTRLTDLFKAARRARAFIKRMT